MPWTGSGWNGKRSPQSPVQRTEGKRDRCQKTPYWVSSKESTYHIKQNFIEYLITHVKERRVIIVEQSKRMPFTTEDSEVQNEKG